MVTMVRDMSRALWPTDPAYCVYCETPIIRRELADRLAMYSVDGQVCANCFYDQQAEPFVRICPCCGNEGGCGCRVVTRDFTDGGSMSSALYCETCRENVTACECCGEHRPCACVIGPCQVELLSDERGVVWGTGRGCATHRTEL
jgi:hypothetical protein